MRAFFKTGVAVAALICCGSLLASGEGWTINYTAARKEAMETKKDMLLDFSGSDWCPLCIQLDKEVFSKDSFKSAVKDKFVLVTLDYPNDKSKMSAETLKQNEALRAGYGNISQFPTVFLCDPEGRPYAATTYQEGGPAPYLSHLEELRGIKGKRDAAFAAAAKAEGVEKAKILVAALDAMKLSDATLMNLYGDKIQQILDADPKDEAGFRKAVQERMRVAKFEKDIESFNETQDFPGALKLVDDTLKAGGFSPENTQQLMLTRASILGLLERFDEGIAILDKILAEKPDSKLVPSIEKLKASLVVGKMKAQGIR